VQSLFDDVARILAKPAPRRQALKLAAGVLAGGILGSLGFGQDSGPDIRCKSPKTVCGTVCCSKAQQCCATSPQSVLFCVLKTHTCCGNTGCKPNTVCCAGVCCAPHETCKKGRCSSSAAAA
jgi:hypothetical protein